MNKIQHDLWINDRSKMLVVTLAYAINVSDGDKDMVVCCPVDNQHLILVYEKADFFNKHIFHGRFGGKRTDTAAA